MAQETPHRPAPGEELNPGAETVPRESSSTILLRDSAEGVEVLLVRRNPGSRFMGGAWVFPGGAVADGDAGPEETAIRELREEAGIALEEGTELLPFSRWITPAAVRIRFDTRFFVARAPEGVEAVPDGEECVDARWERPAAALEAGARDELMLVFPTIKHLEELAELPTVDAAMESARAREVLPVEPRVVREGGAARVLMPGEPGYEDHDAARDG